MYLYVGSICSSMWFKQALVLLTSIHIAISSTDIASEAVNAFGLDLYNEILAETGGNICLSPISVSMGLSMIYAGAEGNTKTEIADTFDFGDISETEVHQSFQALDAGLVSDNEGNFRLNLANRLFGSSRLDIEAGYQNTISNFYGGELKRLDFAGSPEPSRIHINEWVSNETESKIPELLGEGTIDHNTIMVVVNAIYFKGTWKREFNESLTEDNMFYGQNADDGDDITASVPMMRITDFFKFTHSDSLNAKIIEVPYEGEQVSMVIVLPDAEIQLLESEIVIEQILSTINDASEVNVNFQLPRFEVTQEMFLGEILTEMGMKDLFSPQSADLTGTCCT